MDDCEVSHIEVGNGGHAKESLPVTVQSAPERRRRCWHRLCLQSKRVSPSEVPHTSALSVEGHPLTSVVVTQCNLIVAVYMTMPDGRLLRFDKSAGVPSQQLMTMAYSAPRSERVEVSCNDTGAAGYEPHEPV
jgi:hypothetical protein